MKKLKLVFQIFLARNIYLKSQNVISANPTTEMRQKQKRNGTFSLVETPVNMTALVFIKYSISNIRVTLKSTLNRFHENGMKIQAFESITGLRSTQR